MRILTLPVKRIYFEQIRDGLKDCEYRLTTDYWYTRLLGQHYDKVVITLGYPKKDDVSRRLEFPYRGYVVRDLLHPHFGPDPVEVFAIPVVA